VWLLQTFYRRNFLLVVRVRACVRECAGAIAMEVKRQAMALRASAFRCDANLSLSLIDLCAAAFYRRKFGAAFF
jgi:hypothetical protein